MELCGYYDYTTNYREDVITLLKLACNELSKLNTGKVEELPPPKPDDTCYDNSNFINSRCYGCTLGPKYCQNEDIAWTYMNGCWTSYPADSEMWQWYLSEKKLARSIN